MSTKLIINGRVKMRSYLPTESLKPMNLTPPLDDAQLERQAEAQGLPLQVRVRAPDMIPALAKEEGVPWYDSDDRITYRVLRRLDPALGWGSMGFWMKRWGLSADEVLRLARNNHMDCATEPNSTVKRYRCLDESRTIAVISHMKRSLPATPATSALKGTRR